MGWQVRITIIYDNCARKDDEDERRNNSPKKQGDNNLKSALGAIIQGVFFTVPPDFQNQNEKQVAANQDYFFVKFSM